MESMSLYMFPVALVATIIFGVIWVNKPEALKVAAIRVVVFIAAVVLVAILLAIPGIVRAEEWQDATVNGSVEITLDGETMYLIVYTTDDGYVLTYYDDTELSKGTRIKVLISTSWETLDVEVEEPEPIWFPPFVLVGAVAIPSVSKNKKNKMIQRLVPDLYMTTEKYREGVPSKLAIELTSKKTYVFVCVDDGTKKLFSIPSGVERAIEEINRIEKPAFVTAFVKSYKQQAVIACNYKAHLEYWRGTTISDRINEAYKKLDVKVLSNTTTNISVEDVPVVKANTDKDDPFKQIVEVKYSEDDNQTFTFRCRQAHTPGDYVCVFTKRAGEATKTYKNVKVVKHSIIKESQVKAIAKSLGYSDISEVSHDNAIDTEDAWALWRNTKVDPENDPELYAPSAEEIADFEAMREAYTPGYRDF